MNVVLDKGPQELGLGCIEKQQPNLYEVHLHNDDFTPMTFVVEVLEKLFHLDTIKAKKVTLEAHTKGRAVCGVYSKEIAETRIGQAIDYARMHEHPLRWTMEAG